MHRQTGKPVHGGRAQAEHTGRLRKVPFSDDSVSHYPILDRKSIIEDELPITGVCTLMVIYFTIMATNVLDLIKCLEKKQCV